MEGMTYLRNAASAYQFVSIPEIVIKHRLCSSTVGVIKIKQIQSGTSEG